MSTRTCGNAYTPFSTSARICRTAPSLSTPRSQRHQRFGKKKKNNKKKKIILNVVYRQETHRDSAGESDKASFSKTFIGTRTHNTGILYTLQNADVLVDICLIDLSRDRSNRTVHRGVGSAPPVSHTFFVWNEPNKRVFRVNVEESHRGRDRTSAEASFCQWIVSTSRRTQRGWNIHLFGQFSGHQGPNITTRNYEEFWDHWRRKIKSLCTDITCEKYLVNCGWNKFVSHDH